MDTQAQDAADLALNAEVALRLLGFPAAEFLDVVFGRTLMIYDPEARRTDYGSTVAGLVGATWQRCRRLGSEEIIEIYGCICPAYATRLEDAWKLVTLLRTRGWYCTLIELTPREYPPAHERETWRCTFGHYPQLMPVAAEAPTPARAICMAALRARAARDW
jgi:hypothetical protein